MGDEQTQSDAQISREILEAIRADQPEISGRVRVEAHCGHVTLTGNVGWQHQHDRAEATARLIQGVVSVDNELIAAPCAESGDIKKRIEAAFEHSAELDANQINVRVEQDRVVLTGRVRTSTEWTEAQNVAQSAPGVRQVQNEIIVGTA